MAEVDIDALERRYLQAPAMDLDALERRYAPQAPQADVRPYTGPALEPNLTTDVSSAEGGMARGATLAERARATVPMALNMGLTAGGAAVAGWPGASAGGLLANIISRRTGLTEPGQPLTMVGSVPIYGEDVAAVALPPAVAGATTLGRHLLATSSAAKAIQEANAATEAARTAWQQAADEAVAAQQAGQSARYAETLKRAKALQAEYRSALTTQQKMTERLATYTGAQTAQGEALKTLRGVTAKYQPAVPSRQLYGTLADSAADMPVDLEPVKRGVADLLTQRPVLPTGDMAPLPAPIQRHLAWAQGAENTVAAPTVMEQMRQLGPLTRSANGEVRGLARQLYGHYAQALEDTATALPAYQPQVDLFRQARGAFRRESALADIDEWFAPRRGGPVTIAPGGREAVNVPQMLTRFEELSREPLFRGSFTPAELAQLRSDLYATAGTPAMPRGARPPTPTPAGRPPGALAVPDVPLVDVGPLPEATAPALARPQVEIKPFGLLKDIALLPAHPVVGGAGLAQDLGMPWLMYKGNQALLSTYGRPIVDWAMHAGAMPPGYRALIQAAPAAGRRYLSDLGRRQE